MTDKLWLKIAKTPADPDKDNYTQGLEWDGSSWSKPSDYWYTYSGGRDGAWIPGGPGGRKIYKIGTNNDRDYTLRIDRQPESAIIRNMVVCEVDATPPNIPEVEQADGYLTYARVGNDMGDWMLEDSDPTPDVHHLWIWAQMDKNSPVIRCDPMIYNKGGGSNR